MRAAYKPLGDNGTQEIVLRLLYLELSDLEIRNVQETRLSTVTSPHTQSCRPKRFKLKHFLNTLPVIN